MYYLKPELVLANYRRENERLYKAWADSLNEKLYKWVESLDEDLRKIIEPCLEDFNNPAWRRAKGDVTFSN